MIRSLPNSCQSVVDHDMASGAGCAIARCEFAGDHEVRGDGGPLALKVGEKLAQSFGIVAQASKRDIAAVAQPSSRYHRGMAVIEDDAAIIPAAGIADIGFHAAKRGFLSCAQQGGTFAVLLQSVRGHCFFSRLFGRVVICSLFSPEFVAPCRSISSAVRIMLFFVIRSPCFLYLLDPRLVRDVVGTLIFALRRLSFFFSLILRWPTQEALHG